MPGQPHTPQHHKLVAQVARAMRRRCAVVQGQRLVVAVSGGADSVALLRALHLLSDRRQWRLELAVAHVQHHLRGEQAEADAQFVEALATELDLPFLRADLDWQSPGEQAGTNLQARARRQRYQALRTMALAFEAPAVATAHHADDQLETLLMRLMRGTGVAGLRGIAWRRVLQPLQSPANTRLRSTGIEPSPPSDAQRVTLIRPMLGVRATAALDLLHELGQDWREDAGNADITRTRARLRQQVLPVLEQIEPAAAHKAVALGLEARQMQALLVAETARHREHVLGDGADGWVLDRGEARLMPRVVLGALLRDLLREAGVPGDRLGRRALEPVLRAIRDRSGSPRRFALAGAVSVQVLSSEVRVAND